MLQRIGTLLVACGIALSVPRVAMSVEPLDFERDIRPLLQERCVACHGSTKQKGGLRLDAKRFALKGGDSGAVLIAGKSADSELLKRVVSSDSDERMPPEGARLSAVQIERLKLWIDAGANWPESKADQAAERDRQLADWVWQPVRSVSPPALIDASSTHEVDRFLVTKLADKGLKFAPEADRRTLVRRLTLDLIGLPPTPAEVREFVNDSDPRAYEKLVERLLKSPHYGERQARFWLDVVRFTESDGFEEDMQRNHAWTYRDYVINAFNDDLPYDRFVREQIAGDVLKPVTGASIAATGMLVAGPWDAVQRVTPSRLGRLQSREEQLEEIVATVGQAFLGVTVNCARCHDHKFDPIPQTDYYRMKSVFEGIDHGTKPKVHGLRRMLGDAEEAAWATATQPLRTRIADLDKQVADLDKQAKEIKADEPRLKDVQTKLADARQQLVTANQELQTRFPVTLAFTGEREQPSPTVVFERGEITKPGAIVSAGGLATIKVPAADFGLAENAPEAERRQRFAQWLTDPAHPLTARVMVNRLWQQHFGTGLIDTPSDFGANGGRASHPELLDWLASEFVRRSWSLKQMQQLIVTSAAYRQSSQSTAAVATQAGEVDADNRLLWRFPARALEGEVTRDSLLALSGALNRSVGGPSFQAFTTTQLNTFFYHLFDKDEPAYNRRSIYRMHVITGRSPFLDALDCPSPSVTTPKRRPTVTPLQALALMNDGFVVRQSEQFAARLAVQSQEPSEQVTLAFEAVLSRPPRAEELVACVAIAKEHGLATVCWGLFNTSEFLYLR